MVDGSLNGIADPEGGLQRRYCTRGKGRGVGPGQMIGGGEGDQEGKILRAVQGRSRRWRVRVRVEGDMGLRQDAFGAQ